VGDDDDDDDDKGDIYSHLLQLQNMQIIHTVLFFVHTIRSGINPIFLGLKHFMPLDIVTQNSLKREIPHRGF
jgi:hypothetical protein